MFTVSAGVIYMRPFAIDFKKSGTRVSFILSVVYYTLCPLTSARRACNRPVMHMIALLPVT